MKSTTILFYSSKIYIDDIPVIPPEVIVILKARAWLDLIIRRNTGETVDSNDIKKHKNDVFRLFQIIDPVSRITLPDIIKDNMQRFLKELAIDPPQSLKPFGLGNTKLDVIIGLIQTIYELHT